MMDIVPFKDREVSRMFLFLSCHEALTSAETELYHVIDKVQAFSLARLLPLR